MLNALLSMLSGVGGMVLSFSVYPELIRSIFGARQLFAKWPIRLQLKHARLAHRAAIESFCGPGSVFATLPHTFLWFQVRARFVVSISTGMLFMDRGHLTS